ncbi:MAG: DEAD/DEAH box helicase, partial [Proteobacteria bacterium]|nr:DEAD/DEAH box helicase [Pseudomonadota bacterium]
GYQVALVTPTTLLARQHAKLFEERFRGFPVKVASLSRMVTPKQAQRVREGLRDGAVQMVIGTHALLAKSIDFNHLGLLIIDEEQNFGVAQKERLKELRGDVHVLTLSATPIPRTLQLALSGVRDMSLIATPPVDRLAVRTFVGGWDAVVLKEALIRERFRGGQSFVVCPRIADLNRVYDKLVKMVPDLKIFTAHGKMPAAELDEVMTDFGEGKADLLLSTNIIESGIDIPTANTIIIHRADMFGLSQLYQLRGRVGRSKERAYAYLTTDPDIILTAQAKRRLDVMQTLDTLGAGFSLASYDMDIRGAGNLLGDEQSGHVREVGIELYQDMLKQAVEIAKKSREEEAAEIQSEEQDWSPQISLGTNVLIPEAYVPDLSVRLSLYRRIGALKSEEDIFDIRAECADRFGALPETMNNLLEIVELKQLCRQLNIQKFDAGDKGFALSFRNNRVSDPDALIGWIAAQKGKVLLKADHRLVIKGELARISERSGEAKNWLRAMHKAFAQAASKA